VVAADGLDLTVENGEYLCLLGPTGAGKTTTLRIIAGLTAPDSGQVFLDERDVTKDEPEERNAVLLSQTYSLFPTMTVAENILFGPEIRKRPEEEKKRTLIELLDLVRLTKRADSYPRELSGGMQQRVAIARALAYDPEVLLMDEPFAAVDAQTRETMQDELLRIWEKTHKTIIFVTHSIEEAVGLADRVAVMTRQPGTIKEIVNVNLPRPRRIGDVRNKPDFSILSHRVWELLQDEQEKPGQQTPPDFEIAEKILPDTAI